MSSLTLLGHTVALAQDVAELEACLTLEGAAVRPTSTSASVPADSDGLQSPSAVPYCDFLMVRDSAGALAGMTRLVMHAGDIPVHNPLSNGRFHLSPLLTAIRYSRLDMVEAGPLLVGPGRDPGRIMALLWHGILRYLERSGASIILGRERMSPNLQTSLIPALRAAYGLHPDLEVEARARYRMHGPDTGPLMGSGRIPGSLILPAGLREALDRGCRLAGEPVLSGDGKALEIIWVAFREMLTPHGEDWSRNSQRNPPALESL